MPLLRAFTEIKKSPKRGETPINHFSMVGGGGVSKTLIFFLSVKRFKFFFQVFGGVVKNKKHLFSPI